MSDEQAPPVGDRLDDQAAWEEPHPPQRKPKPRRMRGLVKLMAFFAVLALLLGGAGLYFVDQTKGTPTGKEVIVTIDQGATATSIADRLKEAGVIRSAWLFRLVARMRGTASSLKPGEYTMRTGMSFAAVLDLLEEGPEVPFVRVTIPEGRALGQIADIFQEKLGIKRADFLKAAQRKASEVELLPKASKNLEGLLFPDTYFFKEAATADEAVARLLEEFETKTASLDLAGAVTLGVSAYQSVVVASLIEREGKVDEERARIAGVIYNRLRRGMRLELDATAQYAIYLKTGRMPDAITVEDLQIESPFNTYKIPGLPPAPIASPGLPSLRAALDPEKNDFLFYVLSTDGKRHCFAKTFEEFNAYKNRRRSCV